MKIIGLPDIHGDQQRLKKLASRLSEVDLVLLIGDITNFGQAPEMQQAIEFVQKMNPNCITVPGNCDFPETEAVMTSTRTNLNGGTRLIDNLLFVGLGASLATPSNATPYEVEESYFEEKLALVEADLGGDYPLVMVSHQPPHGCLADALGNGMHVGSSTVRRFIERHQPLVCFTGHIHEGKGIDWIGQTRVINPGPVFQGNYAYAEIDRDIKHLEIRSI